MDSKHIHKVIVVLIFKYNVKMLSAQKGKKTHEMCRLYRTEFRDGYLQKHNGALGKTSAMTYLKHNFKQPAVALTQLKH